jgi:hypothetical protein
MEPLSRFWAWTLHCTCLRCGTTQDADVALWLPHLPGAVSLEQFLTTLPCPDCGTVGSFDVRAMRTPSIAGGRAAMTIGPEGPKGAEARPGRGSGTP